MKIANGKKKIGEKEKAKPEKDNTARNAVRSERRKVRLSQKEEKGA